MIRVKRFEGNPLIVPDTSKAWMSKNVFNCGVVLDDRDHLYKMLFRAAHTEDQSLSDCGLAISTEGTEWFVHDKPVLRCGSSAHCTRGVEDPRIVKWIDGWYYVFASACSPAGDRVGIWRTQNFYEYEWVGVPFNHEEKDASILPEPIDGRAYLIHRRAPDIWLSRTRDLRLRDGWGESQVLVRAEQLYRKPEYGGPPTKIGLAGPPVRAPKGWLVIIHVVHGEGILSRVYTLSFVVLDLVDPSRVTYVHQEPILEPEDRWELAGQVPNVVFSCATVDTGGDSLYLYWGGADTVICGGQLFKRDLPMCYEESTAQDGTGEAAPTMSR